jgi:hypothetical protein
MDLAQLATEVGAAATFGVGAFILLRVVLRETAAERAEWLKFMSSSQERNLDAIKGLEQALIELRHAIRDNQRPPS